MNVSRLPAAICACMLTFLSHSANAALLYDQNVTNNVIMGTGITNGGWTVDQSSGVELGLRAKLRHDGAGQPQNIFNSNGDGTYSFDSGVAPTQVSPTAVWSFEWSINSVYSGALYPDLNDLTYELGIDSDPTLGTSYGVFDPINDVNPGSGTVFWDHAIGNNSTAESAGTVATDAAVYLTLVSNNNLAQNSWKPHWFIPGFDPTVDGQYEFYLAAIDGTTEVARTQISVIVGDGAVVPVPAAAWLFGSGLLGLLGLARRKA